MKEAMEWKLSYCSLFSSMNMESKRENANKKLGDYEKRFNEVRAGPGKASEWLNKIKQ